MLYDQFQLPLINTTQSQAETSMPAVLDEEQDVRIIFRCHNNDFFIKMFCCNFSITFIIKITHSDPNVESIEEETEEEIIQPGDISQKIWLVLQLNLDFPFEIVL